MFLREPKNQALHELPDGIDGVIATLRFMAQIVKEYKINPIVREKALALTRFVFQKDFIGEVQALFDFVQNHVRYVHDIEGVETLQTPDVTLDHMAGDCDDKSILLASLLASIGYSSRFRAVGFARDVLEHVYVEVKLGTQWIALDATEPNPMGWAPPGVVSSYVWHI